MRRTRIPSVSDSLDPNPKRSKQAGYKFILGGRIKKESNSIQDWVLSLEKNPHTLNETVINGDERIIVSYSEQRAAKDRHNRDKGIQRLRKAYASG